MAPSDEAAHNKQTLRKPTPAWQKPCNPNRLRNKQTLSARIPLSGRAQLIVHSRMENLDKRKQCKENGYMITQQVANEWQNPLGVHSS